MSHPETAAGASAPARSKNLPNRILRAVDYAMHLAALPRALRPTLAEIARYVPQDRPFDTVFAKKASIARRIAASVETVYRHLRALKTHGMIVTLEQERKSRNGRFAVARIRLTEKAAALLGFIAEPVDVCAAAVDADAALPPADPSAAPKNTGVPRIEGGTSMPVGAAIAAPCAPVIHSPPHGKMTDGHTLTEPTGTKPQLPARTENGLPADLAWLTGNGVSRAGVFCLMGLATARHKRLSDIVTVVGQRIRAWTGSRLFAYLAALCRGPTDFSAAAATERLRRQAEQAAQAVRRKAALFRERFKNVALTNPAQTLLIRIDRHCAFAQVFDLIKPPATMPLHDLKPLIEAVDSGRLVMATDALERRFAFCVHARSHR